jgi:hypothetical protein
MTANTAQLIDYILDNMSPEKVLDMPMPSDNEAASELVSALKQRVHERHDDLPMPVEDPTDEQIAASIVRGLEQVRLGKTKPIAELWAKLEKLRNP